MHNYVYVQKVLIQMADSSTHIDFLVSTVKHIQKTDGSLGLYRGLFPRIWANATTSITYSLVSKVSVQMCCVSHFVF